MAAKYLPSITASRRTPLESSLSRVWFWRSRTIDAGAHGGGEEYEHGYVAGQDEVAGIERDGVSQPGSLKADERRLIEKGGSVRWRPGATGRRSKLNHGLQGRLDVGEPAGDGAADAFQRRLGSGRIRVCDDLKLGRLAGHHVAGEIAGEGEEAGKLAVLDGSEGILGKAGSGNGGVWERRSGSFYDLMADPSHPVRG